MGRSPGAFSIVCSKRHGLKSTASPGTSRRRDERRGAGRRLCQRRARRARGRPLRNSGAASLMLLASALSSGGRSM